MAWSLILGSLFLGLPCWLVTVAVSSWCAWKKVLYSYLMIVFYALQFVFLFACFFLLAFFSVGGPGG